VPARGRLAVLLALAMALGAPPARGAEPGPAGTPADLRRAREFYRRGKEAYAAGRYAEAHALFEEGFRLSGRPLFLLNMAHARRRDGALAEARALCQRFLALEPQSQHRAEVESLLAEIEAALWAGSSTAGPGAPRPAVPAPAAGPAPAPTPPLLPTSAAEARPLLGPRLEPADAPAPPLYRRWWVWAAMGAAAVVATGLVLASDGSGARKGTLGTLGAP
jgi:hypothetical protein